MQPKTPIILVTGSLGSGKTTLLKRILRKPQRRMAVLMNEFGEIAVDSKVIQGRNVQIVELLGGCVCCSLTGEFEAAVREIIHDVQPEFIIVEATGVAESDALVYGIQENLPEVRLDCVVFIVDAYLSHRYPHIGYTTLNQLKVADVILINKIDQVTTDVVNQVENQIRRFNAGAMYFRTMGCDVDTNLLFGLETEERPSLPRTPHGEAPLQSFAYTTDARLDEEKFRYFISALPPLVFRVKGFVRFHDTDHIFNYVVGRADLEEFHADKTQLVFIGRHLNDMRQTILEDLKECEVKE
ncbi:CobW family GTP-binding protein [Desulforhabdus amnigena]|uniref:Zinc transporter n=1 Tax=Desulforhabdus amnigena TaxID=40218 RepID=A0A9W6L894_9BACT|nr:GTP-binding protein [Desulforhabdus amnigena]NLJ28165.1 GTP-binding protein [Deltaproteobacteria bacterium]GLI35443.1 zinc transporter [Desulforhabdus amnigena]